MLFCVVDTSSWEFDKSYPFFHDFGDGNGPIPAVSIFHRVDGMVVLRYIPVRYSIGAGLEYAVDHAVNVDVDVESHYAPWKPSIFITNATGQRWKLLQFRIPVEVWNLDTRIRGLLITISGTTLLPDNVSVDVC